ncbi:hypothetical protein ACOME3_004691 [Neoechinorhynchus agilis]
MLENQQINSTKALWLRDPKEISTAEYQEFYQYIQADESGSISSSTPHYTIHCRAEAPMTVRAILFVPQFSRQSSYDFSSMSASDRILSLYNRNVLITNNAQSALLPNWLRFVRGVVESEDIPLNLSREMLQDGVIINRLKTILVKKIIRYLVDESERDPDKYNEFYKDFGLFFKDGIARSQSHSEREDIARLLRFQSNALNDGKLTNLDEYVKRMNSQQRYIYYLASVNRDLALSSPYFETFLKTKPGEECLFLLEPHDEAVRWSCDLFKKGITQNESYFLNSYAYRLKFIFGIMAASFLNASPRSHHSLLILHLSEFNGKRLQSIEQEADNQRAQDDNVLVGTKGALSNEEAQEMKKWMITTFADKIKNVKINTKLARQHPLAVTTPEMGAVRNFINSPMSRQSSLDLNNLCRVISINADINPSNPIITAMFKLKTEHPQIAKQLGNQLIQNAMVTAGLIADPRMAMDGVNDLIEKLVSRSSWL